MAIASPTRFIRFEQDPEVLKREDTAYWQARTPSERFAAVRQMSLEQYAFKGITHEAGQRLSGPVVRLQRARG